MRRGSKHSDELPSSKVAVLPTNALLEEHVSPSSSGPVSAAKPSIAAWLGLSGAAGFCLEHEIQTESKSVLPPSFQSVQNLTTTQDRVGFNRANVRVNIEKLQFPLS